MVLLSVENMVLLQYYSRLQYNQGLDLFLLLFYMTTGWREDFMKLSASKLSGEPSSGYNNTHIFKQEASEAG